MKLTAENLDTVLYNAGNLILARRGDDGDIHRGVLNRYETVAYSVPITYDTPEAVVEHVTDMSDEVVALIHKYPNRPTAKYVVKIGKVL